MSNIGEIGVALDGVLGNTQKGIDKVTGHDEAMRIARMQHLQDAGRKIAEIIRGLAFLSVEFREDRESLAAARTCFNEASYVIEAVGIQQETRSETVGRLHTAAGKQPGEDGMTGALAAAECAGAAEHGTAKALAELRSVQDILQESLGSAAGIQRYADEARDNGVAAIDAVRNYAAGPAGIPLSS